MRLTQFSKEDIPHLVGNRCLRISQSPLTTAHLNECFDVDTRSIFIGLGGTGIRIIDRLKGMVKASFSQKDWIYRTAFLGIDRELERYCRTEHLSPDEIYLSVGDNSLRDSASENRTAAQRRMFPDEHSLCYPFSRRQNVIAWLYGKDINGNHVDQHIVELIRNILAEKLLPAGIDAFYDIYVVGSLAGDTGSALFTQMPALIRQALIPHKARCRALALLPDLFTWLDPHHSDRFGQNGYAALKELDYYMGVNMRPGYTEYFPTNNSLFSKGIPLRNDLSCNGFYDQLALFDNDRPDIKASREIVEDRVSGFLLDALRGTKDVLSGATFSAFDRGNISMGQELRPHKTDLFYENLERPGYYGSFGNAVATMPETLIRTYYFASVSKAAGLCSVDEQTYAEALASHTEVFPFRGENHYYTIEEGKEKTKWLISMLSKLQEIVYGVAHSFTLFQHPALMLTWDRIINREYESPVFRAMLAREIDQFTGDSARTELRSKIKALFEEYRGAVQNFVKKEGPHAFCNLFKGHFDVMGDDYGYGIETMLENTANGNFCFGAPFARKNTTTAECELERATAAVMLHRRALIYHFSQKKQVDAWVAAFETLQKARINDARHDYVFGEKGIFAKEFLEPARAMAEEIRCLGFLLDSMAEIYLDSSRCVEEYGFFITDTDPNEMNLCRMHNSIHRYLKEKVDMLVAQVNPLAFRNAVLDDFFLNPDAWLNIPDGCVETDYHMVQLVSFDKPIPARRKFEQLLCELLPSPGSTSLAELQQWLAAQGVDLANAAGEIARELSARCRTTLLDRVGTGYAAVFYPASIGGTEFARALQTAFYEQLRTSHIVFFETKEETVRCYCMTDAFALYKLPGLRDMEQLYLKRLSNTISTANTISKGVAAGIHCMSPAATEDSRGGFTEVFPWEKYPAITLQPDDPKLPDPQTGAVSEEGRMYRALEEKIEEAKRYGILYEEGTDTGYVIKMVYSEMLLSNAAFDLTRCPVGITGEISPGRVFAESVAAQNNIPDLGSISETVRLEGAGFYSEPAKTGERAWKNATRVLRAHVPMYLRLCNMLEKFCPWGEEVQAYNVAIRRCFRPAKAMHLLKSLVVKKASDGVWEINSAAGRSRCLANLETHMLRFLPPEEQQLVKNGLLCYFLYCKIDAALPDETLDELYKFSEKQYEELLLRGDMEELEKGLAQAEIVTREAEALVAKGMPMEPARNIDEGFRRGMEPLKLTDEELAEIQNFYYYATHSDL